MHGCDLGADSPSHCSTHCSAISKANGISNLGAYCRTDIQAHGCSLGVAYSCTYSNADACTDASSMRRRLARMP